MAASELIVGAVSNGRDEVEVLVQDDCVELLVSNDGRFLGAIMLDPGQRDEFARLWMEACRRADGEPPAMPGQGRRGDGEPGAAGAGHG